ncbi:MAG: hypothetical protein OEO23_14930 [Gemmatimonadota bacterium]|nr:hypothetical protein [Gemmatimonadota bacterium]
MRVLWVAAVVLLACSAGDDDLLESLSALGIHDPGPVYVVSLAGWGGREQPVPDTVRVPPGAVVVFQVADFRVHTVTFAQDSLSSIQSGFIARVARGQSPPLIERGSRYIVSFAEAPPGTYPFRIGGFGASAGGAVVVVPGSP